MRKWVVRAGGVIAIIAGVVGLVGVFMGVAQMQSGLGAPVSILNYSQFFAIGGLAIGLIGIGVALLGMPDR